MKTYSDFIFDPIAFVYLYVYIQFIYVVYLRQSTKLCDDKEKHLKMHLKCIENILNDSQNACHFDNEIGRGVNNPQKRVADGSNVSDISPFNKQKIVPVLLEEDDLER